MSSASSFFGSLGHSPPHAGVAIADHMLDTVIRSPKDEVDWLVDCFVDSRWVTGEGGGMFSSRSVCYPCHG